jgi:hypothetical protein
MKSKLQLVVRFRGILFCSWLALVMACGVASPTGDLSLSPFTSLLILCAGMATVLLGISVAIYLVSLWKTFASVSDRFDYIVSLGMDTIAGVPVLLVCLILPAVGAFDLLAQLISLH